MFIHIFGVTSFLLVCFIPFFLSHPFFPFFPFFFFFGGRDSGSGDGEGDGEGGGDGPPSPLFRFLAETDSGELGGLGKVGERERKADGENVVSTGLEGEE